MQRKKREIVTWVRALSYMLRWHCAWWCCRHAAQKDIVLIYMIHNYVFKWAAAALGNCLDGCKLTQSLAFVALRRILLSLHGQRPQDSIIWCRPIPKRQAKNLKITHFMWNISDDVLSLNSSQQGSTFACPFHIFNQNFLFSLIYLVTKYMLLWWVRVVSL